ncbi:MAG: lanthionine synthetase C family protein [Gaiellaceae bacterium]
MLFTPRAHERLIEDRWDPDRARAAIREIAEDTEGSFDDGWPTHPQDIDDEVDERRRFRTVYLGGAGVVQALDSLQRSGLVELRRDYVSYLERSYEPDFPDYDHERSLWMGETGIRLVLHRLSPSPENADRLAELIAGNARDERRELMWGSPGTMLVAAAMHELTGEARWLDLWRESAAWLRDEWDLQTGLWTQRLYGMVEQWIGPAHGFAGCVLALSQHADGEVHRRAAQTTARYAVEEDGLANWFPRVSMESLQSNGDGSIRMQWCHGAPGVVASLARVAPDDDEHERLLLAGGELTWRAGPLSKGSNLCHGTAGNGYAFLALFERTGDELWFERARAFAMHSIAQVARARAELGRGRYSLWTGDPGTALYLADCLAGGGTVPLP